MPPREIDFGWNLFAVAFLNLYRERTIYELKLNANIRDG
jgi:hypothetical protein